MHTMEFWILNVEGELYNQLYVSSGFSLYATIIIIIH